MSVLEAPVLKSVLASSKHPRYLSHERTCPRFITEEACSSRKLSNLPEGTGPWNDGGLTPGAQESSLLLLRSPHPALFLLGSSAGAFPLGGGRATA